MILVDTFPDDVMAHHRLLRSALWTAVGVNALGVAAFLPLALGQPSRLLPISAPPYFAAQLTLVIAIFGVIYGWLAVQPRPLRPLLLIGASGKLGFFGVTAIYAILGDVPASMVAAATPDLVLAIAFLFWGRADRVMDSSSDGV